MSDHNYTDGEEVASAVCDSRATSPARDIVRSCSGTDLCVEDSHNIQNHVNGSLVADRSIDHGVVNGAIRPLDVEILLDEIHTLPVNGIDELLGFLVALAASQQAAPELIVPRSVEKNSQRVLAVLEKLL